MGASEQNSGKVEKLADSTVKAEVTPLAEKVSVITGAGAGLLVLGFVFLLVAAELWSMWTSPTAGVCFPPGGGSSIPCPASELTSNNLAFVIFFLVVSTTMIALGSVLVCLAWLHEPVPGERTA